MLNPGTILETGLGGDPEKQRALQDFIEAAGGAFARGDLRLQEGELAQGWVEVFPELTDDERRLGQGAQLGALVFEKLGNRVIRLLGMGAIGQFLTAQAQPVIQRVHVLKSRLGNKQPAAQKLNLVLDLSLLPARGGGAGPSRRAPLVRFATQSEVKRFLEAQPCFPQPAPGYVRQQEVFRLLSRPIYAGFITHDAWDINWVKGHHEPLITLETYEKIQERRRAVSHAPARKDINADFPLRGFVLCGDCDKHLTAGWSKGKYKRYPYYLCKTRGCPSCRKSIRKDAIEGDFADVVRTLQPSENLFAITRAMFNHAWSQRSAQLDLWLADANKQLRAVEKQVENLLERIVESSSPSVISAYETKIEKLEHEKRVIQEKLAKKPPKAKRFEQLFELSMCFLSNPWKLWESSQLTRQRTVLKLAFSEQISYSRENGFRTPKTTLPFKALAGMSGVDGLMFTHNSSFSGSKLSMESMPSGINAAPSFPFWQHNFPSRIAIKKPAKSGPFQGRFYRVFSGSVRAPRIA